MPLDEAAGARYYQSMSRDARTKILIFTSKPEQL